MVDKLVVWKEQVKDFRLHMFATGNYMCKCSICKIMFLGDKRCCMCFICAINDVNKFADRYKKLKESLESAICNIKELNRYYKKDSSNSSPKDFEDFIDEYEELLKES